MLSHQHLLVLVVFVFGFLVQVWYTQSDSNILYKEDQAVFKIKVVFNKEIFRMSYSMSHTRYQQAVEENNKK